MLERIILLTGPVEGPVLATLLRRHNPDLTVQCPSGLSDIEKLTRTELSRSRLIGFLTSIIVPVSILEALGFGAYNFHPGPPEYPGWLPSHLAIHDRATCFGATVHVMAPKVDAGPIVDLERFSIPPGVTVQTLEEMAFVGCTRLFWRLAKTLATLSEPLDVLPVQWSGRKSTRAMYAAACDIPIDIDEDELNRRIAAFGAGLAGVNPTVRLHGHQFRYVGSGSGTNEQPQPAPILMAKAG